MTTTTDPDRAQARRDALLLTLTGPLITVVLVAAWAVTGAGYFWPAWPLLGWGMGLLKGQGSCRRLWRADREGGIRTLGRG